MVFELRGGENTRMITENVGKRSQAFNFSRKKSIQLFSIIHRILPKWPKGVEIANIMAIKNC